MFMAALLVVTPNCKQLKCLTIGDQLSTQWHIHISESYLAIKRNGLHIDTQNNLDGFQGHYAEIKTLIIRRLILYYFIYITSFLRKIFIFRERIWEGEREGNINVWQPVMHPLLGTWPATQACALTGNGTSHPLVHRPALNPLSHTSQGYLYNILKNNQIIGMENKLGVARFQGWWGEAVTIKGSTRDIFVVIVLS